MDFWGVLFEWWFCGALLAQKRDRHNFGSATKPASNLAGSFFRGRDSLNQFCLSWKELLFADESREVTKRNLQKD